jgi:hypothetical protein
VITLMAKAVLTPWQMLSVYTTDGGMHMTYIYSRGLPVQGAWVEHHVAFLGPLVAEGS